MPSSFLAGRGLATTAALLAAGRPDDAVRAIPDQGTAAGRAALAQAALQRGHARYALAHAREMSRNAGDPTERLIARTLAAVASARLGRPFKRFSAHELLGIVPEALPEALLGIAAAATISGDGAAAERWLSLVETKEPEIRARRLLLQGRLAAGRCRFVEQTRLTAEALHHLAPRVKEEAALVAEAAQIYADLEREIPVESPADLTAIVHLPQLFHDAHVEVLRARAQMFVLRSDYQSALETLLRATAHAQTPLATIAVQTGLAAAAAACGDVHAAFARAAIDIAAASTLSIRWDTAQASAARVVPQLLQLCAESSVAHTASIETLAVQIREMHLPQSPAGDRARYQALFQEATAYVCSHRDKKAALAAAKRAYELFDSFQFEWRAGRLALFIYQMTGSREWERLARKHLKRYPESRYFRLLDAGNAQRLTHRQQQVLDGVLRGHSPVQIALHLRIAEDTVRKHLKPIMRHFGVTTRLELLARHFKDHDATFQRSESIGPGENP